MNNNWNTIQDLYNKSKEKQFQNKFKNDECYIYQYNNDNKSIFGYVTNQEMYINENKCSDFTPPFQNYISSGKPKQNVDIENDLFNITRNNSRCVNKKYVGKEDLIQGLSNKIEYNNNLCKSDYKILPNGYNL